MWKDFKYSVRRLARRAGPYCTLFMLFLPIGPKAQPGQTAQKIIDRDSAKLVALFQDIHRNPEPGFRETRTADIVSNALKELGCEVREGIGGTGVIGIMRNGPGPVVLYRADMDCNSVQETTGLPYASTRKGKNAAGGEVPLMHACGHDAHVVWWLGAARALHVLRKQWKGTVIFLAQPAEELLLGALAMMADSFYARGVPSPDYLFAMHTWPTEVGLVYNGPGVRSSGSAQLDVLIRGIGGHGSAPDRSKDPVLMASEAILQYQAIVSRRVPPQETAVLTVSSVHAGSDYNVIPDSVHLKLNLRWFSNPTRDILLDGIENVHRGIVVANGLPDSLRPVMHMRGRAVPLRNDTVLVRRVNKALGRIPAVQQVIDDMPPMMGSEDFPFLAEGLPGAAYDYLMMGIVHPEQMAAARKEGKTYPFHHHSPNYRVDLSAIPLGAKVAAVALLEMLTGNN